MCVIKTLEVFQLGHILNLKSLTTFSVHMRKNPQTIFKKKRKLIKSGLETMNLKT